VKFRERPEARCRFSLSLWKRERAGARVCFDQRGDL